MIERRLKLFRITEDCLLEVLRGEAIVEGLPIGAKIERVNYDFASMSFGLMCSHESFHPVPEGCVVPWGDPLTIRSNYTVTSIAGFDLSQTANCITADCLASSCRAITGYFGLPPELVGEPSDPKTESWRDRPSLL